MGLAAPFQNAEYNDLTGMSGSLDAPIPLAPGRAENASEYVIRAIWDWAQGTPRGNGGVIPRCRERNGGTMA